jgi:hypothetical protein
MKNKKYMRYRQIASKEVEDLLQSKNMYKSKIRRWFDSIYNSDRISGATDKVMTTKAYHISIPRVYSGKGP